MLHGYENGVGIAFITVQKFKNQRNLNNKTMKKSEIRDPMVCERSFRNSAFQGLGVSEVANKENYHSHFQGILRFDGADSQSNFTVAV